MGRPREFDEDRALEGAMRAFWTDGYEATSAERLCAATGLGRGSVYNAFGSKHQLFERALTRYMEEKNAEMDEVLASDLPTREKVRILLRQAIDPPAGRPAGCLVVNSMVELAPRDPTVASMLGRDYRRRWRALSRAFAADGTAGSMRAGDLAHVVLATITSLRVMVRAGAGRPALEAVVAGLLRTI